MTITELLLSKKLVTERKISEAVQARNGTDERIEQTLLRLGTVSEEDMMSAYSELTGLPYVDLGSQEIDTTLIEEIPAKYVFRKQLVPISRKNGLLTVATANPLDLDALDELRLLLRCNVTAVIAKPRDILKLIKKHYGVGADSVEEMVTNGKSEVLVLDGQERRDGDITDASEDASLIKFVNQLFIEALQERATDIHVEPMETELRIRYRVDGVLHPVSMPPHVRRFQAAIISRLKIMANLNIAEKRLPQDGRIKLRIHGREIDVRVSVIPNVCGEGLVLRLLDRASIFFSLEQLGMVDDVLRTWRQMITEPHGILLVTGPTGSGKTTTLYAALQKVNSDTKKIITVEDPVEYQLEGIHQIHVRPKIGLTFASGLRHILRHDPNIIMIGEIRDLETAEIAIQASLTGHLVFSTLHTNDAPGAITRLIDMGVEPYLVASSVEGVLAQRLVRRICQNCRKSKPTTREHIEEMFMPEDIKEVFFGTGCEECRTTGYRGRSGLYEMLVVDEQLKELVMQRAPSGKVKKFAIEHGMRTLRDDGWMRVRTGATTPEEVLRVTKTDRF
jgi:type II secretion system protein E